MISYGCAGIHLSLFILSLIRKAAASVYRKVEGPRDMSYTCKAMGSLRCPLKPSPGQNPTLGCRMWPHKPCPERLQSNKATKKCPTCFLDFIHPTQMIADKVHNTKLSWTRTTVLSSWCNHHYLSSLRHLPWWRRQKRASPGNFGEFLVLQNKHTPKSTRKVVK